jgi:putative flippase GtrA
MKLVRYFFVGGAAALVDFGLFALLARVAGLPWFPVALFSFTLATLLNYLLSVRHVFESGIRFTRRHELMLVYLVSAVGLAINQVVLWFGIESARVDMLVAKLIATGTVFFWNYGARRYFIFNERVSGAALDDVQLDCSSTGPGRDG